MKKLKNHGFNTSKLFYTIAEIGINHGGDLDKAKSLIDSAVRAGADSVKFQTYLTEKRTPKDSPIFDILKQCELPFDAFEKLKNHDHTWRTEAAMRIGQVYLCSEFLKNIGHDIDWTLVDSFNVFKDRFVIIDQAAIKLYWHKYTLNDNRYSKFGFFDPELSFNDWLVLYRSTEKVIVDETVVDRPI